MFLPCTQTCLSPSLVRLHAGVALARQNRAVTGNIEQRIWQNCTPCSSGREPRVQPSFEAFAPVCLVTLRLRRQTHRSSIHVRELLRNRSQPETLQT